MLPLVDFAVRLVQLKNEGKWSQKELAEKIRVNPATLSNYEHRHFVPDLWTLLEIAKVFDVSLDYLCGLSEVRKPVVNMLFKDWQEKQE